MIDTVFLEFDGERLGAGVVETENLKKTTITGAFLIRCNDAVGGLLF